MLELTAKERALIAEVLGDAADDAAENRAYVDDPDERRENEEYEAELLALKAKIEAAG